MKKLYVSLLCVFAAFAFAGAGESYNVGYLSDMHYGAPESFAVNPETGKLFTKKNPQRMVKVMEDCNVMYRDMAKKFDNQTAFVAVGGDLIEGMAKNEAVHAEELSKALAILKKELPRPIFCVNGNHDAKGMGGQAAFDKVMIPFLREMTGNPKLETPEYVVRKGEDLWIFADCYAKNRLAWLLKTVRSIEKKPRYLFVVLHENVLQFATGQKAELLKELEKYNTVILCGHSHKTLLLSIKRPGCCRVSQFSIGTYVNAPLKNNRYKVLGDTPQKLMPELEKRCVRTKNWDVIQKEIVPYWDQAVQLLGAGYAMLHISDSGIEITVQSAYLEQKPFTLKLR